MTPEARAEAVAEAAYEAALADGMSKDEARGLMDVAYMDALEVPCHAKVSEPVPVPVPVPEPEPEPDPKPELDQQRPHDEMKHMNLNRHS